MAALLLRRLMLQTVKTENNCVTRLGTYALHRTAPALPSPRASVPTPSCPIHTEALGTVADAQDERKKKKKNDSDFSNIGRKIHERVIHVLDEAGNDLGHMHRADVIRLMNERDLRLVKRDSGAQPPQYQLLTGVQIHEERLRLRESEKAHPKPVPTLTKELTFSSNIGRHDLDTKSKQIQQWLEKKYKVQITIKKGKNVEEPENKMEEMCHQILQTVPGIATFSTRPQPVRGGRAVMCVLRPLSKKEEHAYREAHGTPKEDTLNKENRKDRESDVVHP
ncbi:translation initiation factor IF-3, mitochondrial [Hyaena hyaena]|uniref:translation initiation factor IF-3, mitochondrial n=1 Tax=Hyaena hyaena TaxID=95912 RepID=UPI0019250243|nr:translation initiation factor IF-3, mitochondrial [Hyaena hyaena]XP_039110863.1 translation initiation factor IF-3, mitochondrial [Hyaena hyaena]XP_039110870.1 translation initiation factor IF-3, mitochondrial [Hyaena hyaena]